MQLAKTLRSAFRRDRTAALAKRSRQRLALESLEQRLALAVTMTIDPTALGLGPDYGVWVSGFANASQANFKWLDATNKFVTPTGNPAPTAGDPIPLLPITTLTTITFDGSDTLAGGQLQIFVSAISSPPTAPRLVGTDSAWGVAPPPTAPYLNRQTFTDYGTVTPFDIVEFTYEHAAEAKSTFDLSAVNAFGLPLTLSSSATDTSVGVQAQPGYSRDTIGKAFDLFMNSDQLGVHFQQLKYGPKAVAPFVAPPTVPASQFFAIVNPWYWIDNQGTTSPAPPTGLNDYWHATLDKFFTPGNALSINLASGNSGNIYEGTSSLVSATPTYTFSQADYSTIQSASMAQSTSGVWAATITLDSDLSEVPLAGSAIEVSGVSVVNANPTFPNGYNGTFTVSSATTTTITYGITPSGTPVTLLGSGSGGAVVTQVTVTVAKPNAGFDSAEWVFGNVFPTGFDQNAAAGDAGLIVDNIWMALNRGVALDGVLSQPSQPVEIKASNGASMNAKWEATIVSQTSTGFQNVTVGDYVVVSNVVVTPNSFFPFGYNGSFKVKQATSDTITYFIPPQGSGSGTPTALSHGGGGTASVAGQSTTAWNDYSNWYTPNRVPPSFPEFEQVYNTYSKFLHYSTIDGKDSRSGGTPIFINNQAYGFSEDENPDGPYRGLEVPSKFDSTITQHSSLTLKIGPWGDASTSSIATVAGDFDGNGLTDIAELKATGQWQVALTPITGNPTTVNVGSTWATQPTWTDFTVIRDPTADRDVVIARASNADVGSWWKLSYNGTTWSTTFVGSWGIPDQWVDIVSGDFDGDGKQDIAGRWQEKSQWWMLSDAAAPATDATYAAKNVQIGQWNPAASWTEVVAGNFTGDADGKDTIAGLTGPSWWLLERTGASSTNTLMTSAWSTAQAWSNFQVGNFTGAVYGQEQIAARSSLSGGWHLLGKNGDSYAVSSMAAWNPTATWLNVVAGDFAGDGTTGIAGRNAATGAWTVLRKTSGTSARPTFTNANFEGAWPTSPQWAQAFAGIYTQQADSPKKFGILGRSVGNTPNTWEKAISSGTAFTSSAAPGYPA